MINESAKDETVVAAEEGTNPDPSNSNVEELVIPLEQGDDIHDRMTALAPVTDDTDVRP